MSRKLGAYQIAENLTLAGVYYGFSTGSTGPQLEGQTEKLGDAQTNGLR
jgi:hypothetical protein